MIKKIKKAFVLFIISAVSFGVLGVYIIKSNNNGEKYAFNTESFSNDSREYGQYGEIMENLQQKYPDIKGWINVENTKISYPLLQSTDNEYYTRRSYDGKADKAGSIIADYRLDENLTKNRNIILYGHNMASGNMFAYMSNPKNFTEAEIEIYSNGVLTIYKPYTAYVESGSEYVKTHFETEREIEDYIKIGKEKTVIDFKAEISDSPYLLTLVTCENTLGLGDKRIVIQAVRVAVYLP